MFILTYYQGGFLCPSARDVEPEAVIAPPELTSTAKGTAELRSTSALPAQAGSGNEGASHRLQQPRHAIEERGPESSYWKPSSGACISRCRVINRTTLASEHGHRRSRRSVVEREGDGTRRNEAGLPPKNDQGRVPDSVEMMTPRRERRTTTGAAALGMTTVQAEAVNRPVVEDTCSDYGSHNSLVGTALSVCS